jgi:hypothetical protein
MAAERRRYLFIAAAAIPIQNAGGVMSCDLAELLPSRAPSRGVLVTPVATDRMT